MRKIGKSLRQLLCLGLALCMVLGILPVAAFAAEEGVAIDATNFPDENFRAYVLEKIDTNHDQVLSNDEISATTSVNVHTKNIADLKGIEYFTSMEILYCNNNKLKNLDLSHNTALRVLGCLGNQLTTLDLSHNTELSMLDCFKNQLTSLNVSNCAKLEFLDCHENLLTSIDVSDCLALSRLGCENNQITALNLSSNKQLTMLSCHKNQLISLDLSNNPALERLSCQNNNLTNLDVSHNTKLQWLGARDNVYEIGKRENFDYTTLPGKFDVSKVSNVVGGKFDETSHTFSFDRDTIEATYDYNVGYGDPVNFRLKWNEQVKSDIGINATNFPDENFRNFVANQYDVNHDGNLSDSEIEGVKYITCNRLGIKTIQGIEYFTNLEWLIVEGNEITSMDLSHNQNLTTLSCNTNKLTSLDMSQNPKLEKLLFMENPLTQLNVTQNAALKQLSGPFTKLTSLDVSHNPNLEILACGFSPISNIDVTKNTKLKSLNIWRSAVTQLDLSQNAELQELVCDEAKLTSLDLSHNPALTKLSCKNNKYVISKRTQFDCSKLPGNFDVTKVSNVVGGTFDTKNNTFSFDAGATEATYNYNVGYGEPVSFKLKLDANVGVEIDATNFPDENFRAVVKEEYDLDKDDSLSKEEIAKVVEITVMYRDIYDLKGIEYFTALEELSCGWNHITQLDVSKNSALRNIDCSWNNLTQLDVSQNTALETLYCSDNDIASLDVSQNTALQALSCAQNRLTSLDVSQNTALEKLFCFDNDIVSLDVSQNTALEILDCRENQLTSLDVSQNTALTILDCEDNAYIVYQCEDLDLTKLPGMFDVTKVSNVVGGTFDTKNNTFTFDAGVIDATYDYHIGNDKTANFKLTYKEKTAFTDVPTDEYYYEPIQWAVEQGITNGVAKDRFAPESACTREQMVTFLWRAAGCPKPQSTENPFTDVKKDYSYDAILWAVEAGITQGVGKDRFAPYSTCTREQMVMFLWRFHKCPEPQTMENPFNDVSESSDYYKATLWAVENEITSGVGGGRFSPKGRCTRGQMATFLYRIFN